MHMKSYKNMEQLIRFIVKKKRIERIDEKRLTVQHTSKDWTIQKDPQPLRVRRTIRFLAASSTILLISGIENSMISF